MSVLNSGQFWNQLGNTNDSVSDTFGADTGSSAPDGGAVLSAGLKFATGPLTDGLKTAGEVGGFLVGGPEGAAIGGELGSDVANQVPGGEKTKSSGSGIIGSLL